jgi:hypothetical protein
VANSSGFYGIEAYLLLMRNRFLISGILLFALVAGAWGNVLAAALCPQMAQGQSCCAVQGVPESGATHDVMDDMQMGDMQARDMQMHDMQMPQALNQEKDSNVLAQPEAGCEHCMSHCQLLTVPNTLREADQTRSGEHKAPPLALADPVSLAPLFVPPVYSKQHAPPGPTTSRYLLFNIFRI